MIKAVKIGSLTASIFYLRIVFLCAALVSMTACGSLNERPDASFTLANANTISGERMSECLVPGQLRNLGSNFTYMTPRRIVQTSVFECKIRGGELVSGS
ncbi:MAG: hypothetical protein V3U88_07495 [Methylococcales bacterium]